MEHTIKIVVTVPESTNPALQKQIDDSVHWAVLSCIDRLRRILPHNVKVEDARLSPVDTAD